MLGAYFSLTAQSGALVAIPLFVRWIIDHGIIAGDRSVLIRSVIALSGLAGVRAIFGFLQGRLAEMAAQQLSYDLRNELFLRLGVIEIAFIEGMETGQILQRAIQDVERLRFVVSKSLLRVFEAVALFTGTLIFMLSMNPVLGVLSLIPVPFLAIQAFFYGKKQRPLASKLQQQLGVMTSALEQNLQGTRLIKAFAQEQQETVKFQQKVDRWFVISALNTKLKSIHTPLFSLIANLGLVVVVGVGGLMVVRGESLGLLVAFTTYLTQLFAPVRRVGAMLPITIQGLASAARVSEILDAPEAVPEPPNPRPLPHIQGNIRFRNVSFAFTGTDGPKALSDIDLTIRAGSQLAVLGATGSGKTTLMALLLRLYDPTSGTIEIDDTDIRSVTLASLRSQIGVVLQDTVLFATTIGQNIAFGRPDASPDEIKAAAEAAQIQSFVEGLPEGYETLVGERGVTLSGGQKQRIAIARALITNPRILILDDATSSVDAPTEERILSTLRHTTDECTTIVIAQRASTCKDADAVLVLEDGSILAHGTHEELLTASDLYATICSPNELIPTHALRRTSP